MLHLYRRHKASCPHRKWTVVRCQCPIYAKGELNGREVTRRALDLTDWAAAQTKIGEWQRAGRVTDDDVVHAVDAAVDGFLADLTTRGLSSDTHGKYTVLLRRRLMPWCLTEGVEFVRDLTLDHMTAFRASWPDAPLAKLKNQERLRAFFRWCLRRKYIDTDPSEGLTKIQTKVAPTLPYTQEEVARIVDAIDRYPTRNVYGHDNRARLRAFVLVLRWSGLRIRDAVTLSWDSVQDGKIRLYTQKTGQHVSVPIPEPCVQALDAIRGKAFPFWSGNGNPKSAVADWQRSLRTLFALAKVDDAHAHRFRDTFAVELLLAGVELSDVSVLLGHSSTRITEKHYAPWVAARQRRLEAVVAKTWTPAPAANDRPASPQSGTASRDDGEPAPPSIAASRAGGPARQPTGESASRGRTSLRLVHSGTASARTAP